MAASTMFLQVIVGGEILAALVTFKLFRPGCSTLCVSFAVNVLLVSSQELSLFENDTTDVAAEFYVFCMDPTQVFCQRLMCSWGEHLRTKLA